MSRGKLYGIGVGPGDPELMTLKAVRLIRECDTVAIPHKDRDKCFALRIAAGAVPELADKPVLAIDMPMTKDEEVRRHAFAAGAEKLREQLADGQNVAFLTLGDPAVYSTFSYLQELLLKQGYETEMVSGVTSFCAAAAALNEPLCVGDEELHIIPGGDIEAALARRGTKVFMKSDPASVMAAAADKKLQVQMVKDCGTDGQEVYRSAEEIKETSGYYAVMIVKEEGE